jgi:hypothetical protein
VPNPALEAAARLGPYFAWTPRDAGRDWRPLLELRDPAVIAERVTAGHRILTRLSGRGPGEIGRRVVASTIFLGLAARLVSPPLGAAALTGTMPLADPARLWWRPVEGGPMPIAYDDLGPAAGGLEPLIRDLVTPVLETFRAGYALSPQVLWGNVASALGGAAGMIADRAREASVPPSAASSAAAVVHDALARPPLLGMATWERPDPGAARWFLVRHNCCLYYRIPGGGTCGDCILVPDAERKARWQQVLSR